MGRAEIHIILHLLVPLIVSLLFYREMIFRSWLLMISASLIDVDHLLAVPLYDPGRCSVGFHPLHSFWVLPLYALLPFYKRVRIFGWGLWIHIGLDALDCYFMSG